MGTLYEVDASGELQKKIALGAGAEVTKTFTIAAAAMQNGGNPSGTTIINGVNFFRVYDAATPEESIYNLVLPNDYKDGTSINFTYVWAPSTGGTGNVRWRYQVNQTEEGESFDSGGINTQNIDSAAPGVIYRRVVGPTFTLSGAGLSSDTAVGLCMDRNASNANDTYAADALLWGVIVSYTSDSLGD